MRLSKAIELEAGRIVTVRELTVGDVRRLLVTVGSLDGIQYLELLGSRFADVAGVLSSCLNLPDGEDLEGLSFSEVEAIAVAFQEVNAAFFGLLVAAEAQVPR